MIWRMRWCWMTWFHKGECSRLSEQHKKKTIQFTKLTKVILFCPVSPSPDNHSPFHSISPHLIVLTPQYLWKQTYCSRKLANSSTKCNTTYRACNMQLNSCRELSNRITTHIGVWGLSKQSDRRWSFHIYLQLICVLCVCVCVCVCVCMHLL